MALKLISVNIEGHRHLERILPFLQAEQPDIVCLQEVFEVDLPLFEAALGMPSSYSGMVNVTETSIHMTQALGLLGVAQLTKLPVKNHGAEYYVGSPASIPIFFRGGNPNSMNRVLQWSTVEKDGQDFTVGTTHFTWSTKGYFTDEQARDSQKLFEILDQFPEMILCGDLNSPRDGEPQNVFNTLAKRYQDNIPPEVKTSIDGQFHKAGQLMLMVDALFSSPAYRVESVRVVEGISDHKGLVGMVEKQ